MTFDDKHKKYTRLEAMKVAREQASIREKAADYIKEGKQVPDDLVKKYNQTLRKKLRSANNREDCPSQAADENKDPAPNTMSPKDALGQKVPMDPTHKIPKVALVASRGISMNGVPSTMPSYLPSNTIHRPCNSPSWNCINMPAAGSLTHAVVPPVMISVPGVTSPKPSPIARAWPASPSNTHWPQWRLLH